MTSIRLYAIASVWGLCSSRLVSVRLARRSSGRRTQVRLHGPYSMNVEIVTINLHDAGKKSMIDCYKYSM